MINASPLDTLKDLMGNLIHHCCCWIVEESGRQNIPFFFFSFSINPDTPSITAKLISEQKEDKEKKNHEEKEKMKADNGFQDNYSVVVASGTLVHLLNKKIAVSTLK